MKSKTKIIIISAVAAFVLIVILLFSQLIEAPVEYGFPSADSSPVSFATLIAHPDEYQLSKVTVTGVLDYDFENSALYFSKDNFDFEVTKNAIRLDFDPQLLELMLGISDKELKKLNGQIVTIDGFFNISSNDLYNIFSGKIDTITRISNKKD